MYIYRLKDIKSFTKGHTDKMWQSSDLTLGI